MDASALLSRPQGGDMRLVGMISGTSFDGIDVAVADLHFDGETIVLVPLGADTAPYPADVRRALVAAMPPKAVTAEDLCVLDTRIGQLFAEAAASAITDLAQGKADLIVSHGQTLYHWVEGRHATGTLQIGQPAWIAERTGLPVIADLRARDVAAGGNGAPLASTLDVMLLDPDATAPRAALNLGGIANLTVAGGGRAPIAFDTGPANALIDVAVDVSTGGASAYDDQGRIAAAGMIDQTLLDRMLDEPYYDLEPPKSTGKEHFHLPYLEERLAGRAVDEDVVATVTALTAETVARECHRLGVVEVIAAGGGMMNPTLMEMLSDRLGEDVALRPIDELGLPADSKEAYLFALLGFLTVHGLPGTFPTCTGARRASILGTVVPGVAGLPRCTAPPGTTPARLRIEVAA